MYYYYPAKVSSAPTVSNREEKNSLTWLHRFFLATSSSKAVYEERARRQEQ